MFIRHRHSRRTSTIGRLRNIATADFGDEQWISREYGITFKTGTQLPTRSRARGRAMNFSLDI